jgi:hypothetical protein
MTAASMAGDSRLPTVVWAAAAAAVSAAAGRSPGDGRHADVARERKYAIVARLYVSADSPTRAPESASGAT